MFSIFYKSNTVPMLANCEIISLNSEKFFSFNYYVNFIFTFDEKLKHLLIK